MPRASLRATDYPSKWIAAEDGPLTILPNLAARTVQEVGWTLISAIDESLCLHATPEGFVFALKASQQITHVRQLRDPATTLPVFFERARPLAERLGPVLFQTPPWLKRDDDRLAMFLAELPGDLRCALEVRDVSWYANDTYELLRTRKVALVHAEGERAPSPLETVGATAPFAYLRLRKEPGYSDAEVAAWAERLRPLLARGADVYAYFRHDETGANALSAERLRDALA